MLALLTCEGLFDLFLNHCIDSIADGGDVSSWDGKLHSLGQAR